MKTTLAAVLTFLLAVTPAVAGQFLTEKQKLNAGDGAAGDLFAWKVAIDRSTGDTAVISGVFDDDSGANSGSAYVFVRQPDGSWSQQAKLKPSDGAPGDKFGFDLAISHDTAIIGANLDDDQGTDSGSAYIFTRSGQNWTQQAKLTAPDGAAGDMFGLRVAIYRDEAVVAAPYNDEVAENAGKVYVFHRTGTSWTLKNTLTPDPPASNSPQFGYSVALFHKFLLVGAWRETGPAGALQGSVYVFHGAPHSATGRWTKYQKLTASDGAVGDIFGCALAISPSSYSPFIAVVGACWDDEKGSASGSAYVYNFSVNEFLQQTKLTPADGAAGDLFGVSVAISGDLLVVGAQKDDDYGSNSGAAYCFTSSRSNWIEAAKIRPSDGESKDNFGFHVAVSRLSGIVVGSYSDDDLGSQSGSAYVFRLPGN
ncbi:MAG: hypothetical protein GY722_26510 [bacterium]|nr:hypothetical protein [bacterium]